MSLNCRELVHYYVKMEYWDGTDPLKFSMQLHIKQMHFEKHSECDVPVANIVLSCLHEETKLEGSLMPQKLNELLLYTCTD